MPSDTSVPDAFIAARNALANARNTGRLGGLEWTRLIIALRSIMDGAAVGQISAIDAITYFDNITLEYSAKEEKV